MGMYQNDSDTLICQMCKKPAPYVDVTEIANYGIEMPQLNLCLCRNCSTRYKQFRDSNKERFKIAMTRALREIDISSPEESYEIALSSDTSIFFTQTHLAEVKEILSLLDEYGLPGANASDDDYRQRAYTKKSSEEENDKAEARRNHNTNEGKKNIEIAVGTRVRHSTFGLGIISSYAHPYIKVKFQNVGEKKFRIPDVFQKGYLNLQ